MSKKLTLEEFIQKAKEIHNDKYNYSKVKYKNAKTKVCIVCPKHGEFWQSPDKHCIGQGCPICGNSKESQKEKWENFIQRANKIHDNKYQYMPSNEWNGLQTKIQIICPIHGAFLQKCNKHIIGQGCPECGKEKTKQASSLSFQEFYNKATKVHNNKFSYDEKQYINAKNIMEIICPIHGQFTQEGQSHLQGHGCPKCHQFKLEREVECFLKEKNIDYIFQAKKNIFNWLGKQSFDFYLPQYNIAIECQGEQHFKQKFNFQGHISSENEIENIVNRDYNKFHLAQQHLNGIYYITFKKWFPTIINDKRLQEMYHHIFFNIEDLIIEIKKQTNK